MAEEIARLSLEISNLAHNAWTDRPNAEYLFREIEKRALKIKELAGADTPTGPERCPNCGNCPSCHNPVESRAMSYRPCENKFHDSVLPATPTKERLDHSEKCLAQHQIGELDCICGAVAE